MSHTHIPDLVLSICTQTPEICTSRDSHGGDSHWVVGREDESQIWHPCNTWLAGFPMMKNYF